MARISARDFVGTRARFQRLRDAKVFNGWIEGFQGTKLDVATTTSTAVESGDEFRFEGYGHHISVVFNAKINTIPHLPQAKTQASIDGSSARILEEKRITYQMLITSPLRYAASPESVRVQVNDLYTRLQYNNEEREVVTVDIGPNGIGVVSPHPVELSTQVVTIVSTPLGPIRAQGLVKYCKIDPDREKSYRCGIMFIDMGRVERPKWDRFLNAPTA